MNFDPTTATDASISGLGEEALALAAAYTAGNHWILLWGIIVPIIVTAILVRTRLLERIAHRLAGRRFFIRVFSLSAVFVVASTLLEFPFWLYADWWRESQYGRTNQPLTDHLTQLALGLVLSSVIAGLVLTGVYAFLARTGKAWWLWSGALGSCAVVFLILLSPTFIEPLFNDFEPVPDGEVKEAVEEPASQAGIPSDRIFIFNGSRQSNNFTANVSGIGASARIAISDVALGDASLGEIKAVTGHEIGHYVLGHMWYSVAVLCGLIVSALFLAQLLFTPVAKFFGASGDITDPATLPVLVFILATLMSLAQPLNNAVRRMNESAADAYPLNTVKLPDALASALVKTAEYRNPRPGALQEWLFYTHSSVERSVKMAMDWKAEH
ncbi:MAG: M48 family metalloprotease [OM182 bacterium]